MTASLLLTPAFVLAWVSRETGKTGSGWPLRYAHALAMRDQADREHPHLYHVVLGVN